MSVRDGLALTSACYLNVDELHDHEGSPFNVSSGNRFARNYTRRFLVEMNDPKWGVIEVCLCPGLPSPYSPFINPYTGFFDGLALCVKIDAKRKVEHSPVWIVQCDYSTELPRGGLPNSSGFPTNNRNQSPTGAENNPELEPPEFEFEFEEVNVPARRDLIGKPYVNSAWEPFTPTPTLPFYRTIFHYTRNELNFDMRVAGYFGGTVNDRPFGGWPRDCVLCLPPKAKMQQKGGIMYWRVSYMLKFGYQKKEPVNPQKPTTDEFESFQHEELDQGFRQRIPALYGIDALAVPPDVLGDPILDAAGDPMYVYPAIMDKQTHQPITSPALLDGEGRKQTRQMRLGKDDDGNTIFGPKPVYLQFESRRRTDFGDLFKRGLAYGTKKRHRNITRNPINPLGNHDL